MLKKVNKIDNPLTVIGVFAALTEVGGTITLPFVSDANQATFMWFLILFPFTLLALFFLTLNFNANALYAPQDFQEDASYLIAAGKTSDSDPKAIKYTDAQNNDT